MRAHGELTGISAGLLGLALACGQEAAPMSLSEPAGSATVTDDSHGVSAPVIAATCQGPHAWTFESGTLDGVSAGSGTNSALLSPFTVRDYPGGGKALSADVLFRGTAKALALTFKLCPGSETGADLRGKRVSAKVRFDGLPDDKMAAGLSGAGMETVLKMGETVVFPAEPGVYSRIGTFSGQFPADSRGESISELVVVYGYFGGIWAGRVWLDDLQITD